MPTSSVRGSLTPSRNARVPLARLGDGCPVLHIDIGPEDDHTVGGEGTEHEHVRSEPADPHRFEAGHDDDLRADDRLR